MMFTASEVDKLHVAEFLTKNEGKKCKKHFGQWMLSTSEGYICKKKTSVYILKPFWEIGQSFEESLRGGELIN